MPYIGKEPADIIATAVDTTTGTFSGAVSAASLDADGGVTVDNITIDGTEIDLSSGDLTLDVASNINLDADGGTISLQDGGTEVGKLILNSNGGDVILSSRVSDKDVVFSGNDGGSITEFMRIDSSEGGKVGIGTSSPQKTLDVTGTFAISNSTNSYWNFDRDDSNGALIIADTNTERMRIDSNGSLLVGTTSNDSGLVGARMKSTGRVDATADGGVASIMTRLNSDGNIMQFNRGTNVRGVIGCNSAYIGIGRGDTGVYFSDGDDSIIPANPDSGFANRDDAIDLGHPVVRFDDVRATNGSIQTSDRNEKQDIEELTDAEKRVAVVAKGLMRKFRWKSKVEIKGDKARTHFGIIAQDLEDAFKAEGLDASKYAMFCSDTWWEKEISVDAVEADEEKGIEAKDAYTYIDFKDEATEGYTEKTRLGVRYSELLAFIISAI